jgi:hypothetical protein
VGAVRAGGVPQVAAPLGGARAPGVAHHGRVHAVVGSPLKRLLSQPSRGDDALSRSPLDGPEIRIGKTASDGGVTASEVPTWKGRRWSRHPRASRGP